jgi:hypothetical protein
VMMRRCDRAMPRRRQRFHESAEAATR